jgi:folate-binding protein YgfZ
VTSAAAAGAGKAGGALPEALEAAGVVPDYGDAAAEYRSVREAAGVAERRDLAHLVLHGRDPVRMLQGLITNDLAGAPDDRAVYGAMLTPKGRTIADLRAARRPGEKGVEVRIDLPHEVLAAATDHLRRSIPPLYAKWRDASAELGILGVYGPRSRELLNAVLASPLPPMQEDDRVSVALLDHQAEIVATRYAGGEEGFDLVLDAALLPRVRDILLETDRGLGARLVGFAALEMLRIEAGRPRGGRELTEETIPTEALESTGLMKRAISFGKGCYTGQEVIVRIAHRGHVNRHLRGLQLPHTEEPPEPGSRLFHPESGKDVGWITSVTESPLMGGPVALAFVRREVEPGGSVQLGAIAGPEARVTDLPFVAPERS